MKYILFLLLCLCLTPFANTNDARYQVLTEQLRCLVCQNESLADSEAPLAKDLRDQIQTRLARGETDAQIIRYLTDRYGEFILFKPTTSPKNYLLWFGPFALLFIGLITLSLILYLRQKAARQQTPLTEAEKQHIKQLLQ